VYTTAGFLEIDNNAAERALWAVAIGRKNYLFFGSDVGAETAAVLYTFTQTCQHLGIEPWRYLRDVLERLPSHPPDRLAELLPDDWARAQQAAGYGASLPGAVPRRRGSGRRGAGTGAGRRRGPVRRRGGGRAGRGRLRPGLAGARRGV
jgi:transposase